MRAEVVREVERFLFREARLLDERRFSEWLSLLTEDVRYWAPTRMSRYPANSGAVRVLDSGHGAAEPRSEDGELAILDETKETLSRRIARLETGMAWTDDPPPNTRRLVSNVEVRPAMADKELWVCSNFVIYRHGADSRPDVYVGGRQDVLRHVGPGWRIARRRIVLDQNVLAARHVSVFF